MSTLARRRARYKVRGGHWDLIYPTPPNIAPDETYFHEDIPRMTDPQLRRHLSRAQQRLLLDDRPHPWLLERIDRLKEAVEHAESSRN